MLKFIDCPRCGKSVRNDAVVCYRCKFSFAALVDSSKDDENESRKFEPTEHLGGDGYDDEFDYDRFLEEEFDAAPSRRKQFWYYVTWLMVILMALTSLFAFRLGS